MRSIFSPSITCKNNTLSDTEALQNLPPMHPSLSSWRMFSTKDTNPRRRKTGTGRSNTGERQKELQEDGEERFQDDVCVSDSEGDQSRLESESRDSHTRDSHHRDLHCHHVIIFIWAQSACMSLYLAVLTTVWSYYTLYSLPCCLDQLRLAFYWKCKKFLLWSTPKSWRKAVWV